MFGNLFNKAKKVQNRAQMTADLTRAAGVWFARGQELQTPSQSGKPHPSVFAAFSCLTDFYVRACEEYNTRKGNNSADFGRFVAPGRPHVAGAQSLQRKAKS